MNKRILLPLLIIALACNSLYAQPALSERKDTLPEFLLKNAGNNRIIIGWINNFPDVKQISIQRSFDSLSNYKTILTVPDPAALQNGYMDVKGSNAQMFYRLYIMREKGIYLFSAAKKPMTDTFRKIAVTLTNEKFPVAKPDAGIINGELPVARPDAVMVNGKPTFIVAQPVVIKIDSLLWGNTAAIPNPDYKKTGAAAFTPSLHVYTYKDGYVRITLPDDEKPKKYAIKFFEETGALLFELKDIKEKDFKIDKTSFYHAGWFRFELYEDGKLLENHKLYLEKDF